jgi:hypothetical protein
MDMSGHDMDMTGQMRANGESDLQAAVSVSQHEGRLFSYMLRTH